MITTIQKWGNSQGIRIPKIIIDELKWTENDELALDIENGNIVIRKTSKRKSIEELFEGFSGEYVPTDINWGEPQGEEIW